MSSDQTVAAPRGQQKVFDAWSKRLRGRSFITCEDIDIPAINRELAYISLLACEDGEFRFRLAGTRGEPCALASRCMLRATPVSGITNLSDGSVHFWLRLPLSSNGVEADMVLCHDRYLPPEALADPDRAAQSVDMSLRLDLVAA